MNNIHIPVDVRASSRNAADNFVGTFFAPTRLTMT